MQKNLDRGRPQPKQNILIILLVHKKSGAISWNNVELAACVSSVEHLCQALKSSIGVGHVNHEVLLHGWND